MNLLEVMDRLYRSEINFRVESFWDSGYTAWLGDGSNGYDAMSGDCLLETLDDVAKWLDEASRRCYPDSDYAKERPHGQN